MMVPPAEIVLVLVSIRQSQNDNQRVPGNETGNGSMKYWEIITNRFKKAGKTAMVRDSHNGFWLDANTIPPAHSLDERTYDQRNADYHSNRQGILGCRARAQRSIESEKVHAGMRCLADSSRDGVADKSIVAPTLRGFPLDRLAGFFQPDVAKRI